MNHGVEGLAVSGFTLKIQQKVKVNLVTNSMTENMKRPKMMFFLSKYKLLRA